MKKIGIILVTLLTALSGSSQLATVNQQTVQSVKLDTISARLIRGGVIGGATAANQVISTASLALIKKSNDTLAQSARVNHVDLGIITTSLATITNSLALIKKENDTINQNLRIHTTSLTVITSSLALIKKENDTINQNLRVLNASLTTSVISVAQTYTIIPKTITTTNGSAYSSGDNIGAIVTVAGVFRTANGNAVLEDIFIWDKDNQKAVLQIDFWDASPSGTYTNDAAEVIAGDHGKFLGSIAISGSDYVTQGAVARGAIKNINMALKGSGGATGIFFTIATTSTPTYNSTSGLIIGLGIRQN